MPKSNILNNSSREKNLIDKIDELLSPHYNTFDPNYYQDRIALENNIWKRIQFLFIQKSDWNIYTTRKQDYECKRIANLVQKAIPLFEELQEVCHSENDRELIKANVAVLKKFMEEEVTPRFTPNGRGPGRQEMSKSNIPNNSSREKNLIDKIDELISPHYNALRPGMYEDNIVFDNKISRRIVLLFALKADWDMYSKDKNDNECKRIADLVQNAIPLFEELQKVCNSEEDREIIKKYVADLKKFMEDVVTPHFTPNENGPGRQEMPSETNAKKKPAPKAGAGQFNSADKTNQRIATADKNKPTGINIQEKVTRRVTPNGKRPSREEILREMLSETNTKEKPAPKADAGQFNSADKTTQSIATADKNKPTGINISFTSKEEFLNDLQEKLSTHGFTNEQILDFFDELKKKDGAYSLIHQQRHPTFDKFRLLFKSNKNLGESHFWHTATYQKAVKLLKNAYIKNQKRKRLTPDEETGRGWGLIDYTRGNALIHHKHTSSHEERYNIKSRNN